MSEVRFTTRGEQAAVLSLALHAKLAKEQYPHLRKVGRYTFFAFLAFGAGLLADGLLRFAGMPEVIYRTGGSVTWFVSFMALREMSKAWDLAVQAAAETQAYADDLRSKGEAQ